MKVSIVMATYNGQEFLERQLDTIFTQTILPNEIVIMDDCSSDNTRTILERYKEKYFDKTSFKFFFKEENSGYIQNFIDGINKTSNDLVLLCDQDDEWMPNKIESIIEFFSEYKDCVVLHSNTKIIDKNGKVIKENGQEYFSSSKKVNIKEYIKKVNYPGMAMAFKKEQIISRLNQLRYIGLPTHDWIIGMLGCLLDGFYTTNQILTLRRYTGNNVALKLSTNKRSIKSRIEGIQLYLVYYKFLALIEKEIDIKQYLDTYKYIRNANNRIYYLNNSNLISYILNIRNIQYYPTTKAYLYDLFFLYRRK